MKLASCGRTELRCSVPVLLLLPAAVIAGKLETLLICLLSLTAHELSHAFMAQRLGFPIAALEIQPFGFIARLARAPNTPAESAAIAAAGPMISLLLALCSAGFAQLTAGSRLPALFSRFASEETAEGLFLSPQRTLIAFSRFNLTLGAVNLLPVLPLDGGRLALAILTRRGNGRRGAALLCILGCCCGALIALCGAAFILFPSGAEPLSPAVSFAVTGVFIVIAALSERKHAPSAAVRARLSSAAKLVSGGSVRVEPFAMASDATVRDALRALPGGGYGVLFVTNASLRTLGTLDEGALLAAAMRGETDRRLGSLLKD
ncbi:MAG: hypothetical protein J5544_06930 [Clostridia bacterium]|nr:hypothetical protein [Clostridia bacterium]